MDVLKTMNGGDTAWILICAGLVLFMVPGLALFYAGMVRRSNTLVMLQQNIVPLGVISITWILVGYTIAFGPDTGQGLLGNLELLGLRNLTVAPAPAIHVVSPGVIIPTLAFVVYQMMFAIITPALCTGATAERLKFAGWVLFLAIWSIVVYAPVAHWLFSPTGWLALRGARDWAGGIVVHTSAGATALALLLVVGRRRDWPKAASLPESLPLTIIGAGILWFGWFGFNGGDGLQANGVAAQAVLNTQVAAAAGMLIWLLVEKIKDGHSTVLGAVTGAIAGLATITPCAGYVDTLSAIIIGALAGLICHLALKAKYIFRFDDALDVIAVHFVGGVLGSLLLGLFGESAIYNGGINGLFFGGGMGLLGNQVLALLVVIAFSFCLTWLIAMLIEKTIGLRVLPTAEDRLDQIQQGIAAYHMDPASSTPGPGTPHDGAVISPQAANVPPPKIPQGKVKLLTEFLDVANPEEVKQALLDAGALSIVVSESHVYTRQKESQVIRGYRRDLLFPERLRLEVLVPEERLTTVLQVFERFPPETRSGFVQVAETTEAASN
jgi:Amt family ammonium transporter